MLELPSLNDRGGGGTVLGMFGFSLSWVKQFDGQDREKMGSNYLLSTFGSCYGKNVSQKIEY